jgi:hypothetical protein
MSMTFRAINQSGDWAFGQGLGSYFTRQQAIAANVRTSLLFFLNDYFAALNFGIDWWNLLGAKQPLAQANILLETRKMLASCEGVARINSVETMVDSANRSIRIFYNVDSVLSQSIVGSVQVP